MANYDSDFEVRLATLQALGGDVTIKYDSVYSIDLAILEAIEQGGGGEGMNYNQIKAALAASGVTEILINGDGDSITLDYDLLAQIGQGGGDYVCVDSVDALSGITSPKDGMIAYVAGKGMWKYYAATGVTKWLMFDVDYDTLSADEINTMCNDYGSYRNELTIRTRKASSYDSNHIWVMTPQEYYNNNWLSFSSGISHAAGGKQEVYKMEFTKRSGQDWTFNEGGSKIIVMFSDDNNSCFDYTKNKLTNNGVNSIKFVSGSTSAITLDYELVSQISQGGGGDYICVNTVDELSGITNPKDGMIAYVGEHTVPEEKKVVVLDAYGSNWNYIRFDYGDSNDCHIASWEKGRNFSLDGTGTFEGGGDFKSYDNRDQFPVKFTFNNGATGTLANIEHGDDWSTEEEYKVTVWLDKLNDAYPTVTFDTGESTTVVESGATTETVNIPVNAKGYYKYYADEAKWFAYELLLDNLDATDLDSVMQDYYDYRKPLSGWFKKDYSGMAYRKGFAGGTYDTSEPQIRFTTPVDYTGEWKAYSKIYIKRDGHWGIYNDIYDKSFVSDSDIKENVAQKVYTTSQPHGNTDIGGLYNVGVNETVSGVTISTTISLDATATTENHIVSVYNRNSGKENYETLSEDGWLFTEVAGGISASTSPEWLVIDYLPRWDETLNKMVTAIAAAKIEDNGDDTFTVTYFLTNDNWNGDNWDNEHYGETDNYRFRYNTDRGYTWTVTEHQTLTVTPHLYTKIRFDHGTNSNARYAHKLV